MDSIDIVWIQSPKKLAMLPAVTTTPRTNIITHGTTPDDAMIYLEYLLTPIVNSLREFKNLGHMREITDWWFPICTDDSSTNIKGYSGELKARMIPLFAALGISRDQFNTLKTKVAYKWRKLNAFGFAVVFYRDQGHWWILLDEHENGTILPRSQVNGQHQCPAWVQQESSINTTSSRTRSRSGTKRAYAM